MEIQQLQQQQLDYAEALQEKDEEMLALHKALENIDVRMKEAARVRASEQRSDGLLREMELKNKELMNKIEFLQASIEAAESSHSKLAFDSEVKWTEEIDRLEAVIAELKAEHEFSNQRYEEEVLSLLNDNTSFKQEIRELEKLREEDQSKLSAYEEEIAELKRALSESKKSALKLQESMSSLSDSAAKLEMEMGARASVNRAEVEANVLHLKEALKVQTERTERAEAAARKFRYDFEEKDAEFNIVLQDLINSRLEFAQVSSDIDERNKLISQLEQRIQAKDARILELEEKMQKKKKGLL